MIVRSQRRHTWYCAAFALASVAFAGACRDDPTSHSTRQETVPSVPFRGASFTIDVFPRDGVIRITQGGAGGANTPTALGSPTTGGTRVLPSFSLLGAGVVDLVASNYVAGALDAAVRGKILVTFDLTVINRLAGVRLVTSSFPAPPAGATGVQAFPFELFAIQNSATAGPVDETYVLSPPTGGPVTPSADWDAGIHNFLNDATCGSASISDCFRYEEFGVIEPLGASAPKKVGFLLAPSVRQFRVTLLLSADLATATPASHAAR